LLFIVFAVRLGLGLHRNAPRFFPDEFATFGMARQMSGAGSWEMFALDTYQPGFAILIAPLNWFTSDSFVILHAALVLQSALAVASVVVLAQLVRRFTTMSRSGSMLTSVVISLAPASVGASAAAWAEPLVTLTFLLTLRGLLVFCDTGRARVGAAAIAWSIVGITAHHRLLPLPAVAVVIVVWRLWSVGRRPAAAALSAMTVALVFASVRFSSLMVSSVWDDPGDRHTVTGVLARFENPLLVLDSVVGQTWYQLAATLGMAGVGAAAVALACFGGSVGGSVDLRPLDARVLAATLLPLVGLSALFMSGRDRIDHAVYGRYNDAVLWPLLALGVAWAVGQARAGFGSFERRDTWLIGGTSGLLLATALYLHLRGAVPDDGDLVPDMVSGVIWMSPSEQLVDVIPITLVALGLMSFALVTVRNQIKHLPLLVSVLGLVFGIGVAQAHALTDGDGFTRFSAMQDLAGDPLEAGETVGFRFTPVNAMVPWRAQQEAAQLVQWYLPEIELVREPGTHDDLRFVFAPFNDGDLRAAGASVVWVDERTLIALFRTPSPVDG
ncbi:MAG: hypothetical protein HKN41_01795, partial [Ilumatobacter sp.]|nr:hypothetical protein [Ilumatobacter sp.]